MGTRVNVMSRRIDEDGPALEGWFDIDRSVMVDGHREWDGNNMADVHTGANRGQNLYRSAGGRWIIGQWSNWQGEQTTYWFVTDEDAREWLLLNESDAVVEEYFGEVEEEKGPGRPGVGPATNIRLGEDLTAKVDAARIEGESRAAAIRRLLTNTLA